MCEQCREQDQNPNGIFLHAKTDRHAALAGSLAAIWEDLSPADLDALSRALFVTDANHRYYMNLWRERERKAFKTISEHMKEQNV